MDIRLCDDERIVKSWDYATEGKLVKKSVANLTVTNNRVIATVQGKKRIKRAEMALSDVKRVDMSIGRFTSRLKWLFLVLGLIFVGLYFVATNVLGDMLKEMELDSSSIALVGVGAVFLVVSLLLFIITVKDFKLTLTAINNMTEGITTTDAVKKVVKSAKSSARARKGSFKNLIITLVAILLVGVYLGRTLNAGYEGALGGMQTIVILPALAIILVAINIISSRKAGRAKQTAIVSAQKTRTTTGGIKLHFNKEIIDEIMNELGAVIMDARNNN